MKKLFLSGFASLVICGGCCLPCFMKGTGDSGKKYWSVAFVDPKGGSAGAAEYGAVKKVDSLKATDGFEELLIQDGMVLYKFSKDEQVIGVKDGDDFWWVSHPCIRSGRFSNVKISKNGVGWEQNEPKDGVKVSFYLSLKEQRFIYVIAEFADAGTL